MRNQTMGKDTKHKAKERTQWLRASTALPGDAGSVPAPTLSKSQLPVSNSPKHAPEELTPSSGLCGDPHSCAHNYTDTYTKIPN